MKYQRKLDEVEAFQWTGGPDQAEDPEWIVKALEDGTGWFVEKDNECMMVVLTAYGQAIAKSGDYIFLGKDGINVASKDYFERMFTPALDEKRIREIVDEGDKKVHNDILEFLRRQYGG